MSGFTSQALSNWAKTALAPATLVTSDGLACFAAVTDAGCLHTLIVVGPRKPRDLPEFTWVNTVLGNLKTTLAGAFHAFDYGKYAASYLAEFAYRFNRRFDLQGLIGRLIVDAVRAQPKTQRVIRQAEHHCESGTTNQHEGLLQLQLRDDLAPGNCCMDAAASEPPQVAPW